MVVSSILSSARSIDVSSIFKNHEVIAVLTKRYERLLKYIPLRSKLYLFSIADKAKKIIACDKNKKNQLEMDWHNMFLLSTDSEKMIMIHLAFLIGMWNDIFTKDVMDFAFNTKDKSYRFWCTQEISKITFFHQNGMYFDFYNDRRKLLKLIAEENISEIPIRVDNNKLSICIITYLLSSDVKNSMQRVAMMFANGLIEFCNDITVICLDSYCSGINDKKKINTLYQYRESISEKDKIRSLFKPDVKIKYVNGYDYKDKLNKAFKEIYTYNPDIIIDISDEYSPLSFYYSKDIFTVNVPMRGASTSQFYSAILGVPFKYEQTNKRFNNCIDMSKVLEWSFPEYVPPEQGTITKKDVGLTDNQFCILSIGDNSCFSNDFVDEICRVLNCNDKLVWLLVGSEASEYLHQNYPELLSSRRIIEWGYENNLAGICRACDVHLRYDITGGSGATAIAAMQGLPIVMTNYICDASRWLGLDYSSINNYHDLSNEIQRLYSDREYYEKRKQVSLDLVGKAVDSKEKWENLYYILIDAYERWKTEGHV